MKSVCKTCTQRRDCELTFCPHKFFAYDIDAEKIYKRAKINHKHDADAVYNRMHTLKQLKHSSIYLGCNVAETVLSKVFKNAVRAPYGNPGFDFTCSRGMKIDVKSSCLPTKPRSTIRWSFGIKHNKIADYFLCLAFDDRGSLTPLHLWLIPSYVINDRSSLTISQSTINKWKKYKLPLDKTIACCNTLRP